MGTNNIWPQAKYPAGTYTCGDLLTSWVHVFLLHNSNIYTCPGFLAHILHPCEQDVLHMKLVVLYLPAVALSDAVDVITALVAMLSQRLCFPLWYRRRREQSAPLVESGLFFFTFKEQAVDLQGCVVSFAHGQCPLLYRPQLYLHITASSSTLTCICSCFQRRCGHNDPICGRLAESDRQRA